MVIYNIIVAMIQPSSLGYARVALYRYILNILHNHFCNAWSRYLERPEVH